MSIKIFHGGCLEQLPKIKDTIDFVLVDLPYGQTACEWDSLIDLKQMWVELKKACKKTCVFAFFCTTKFGFSLISSNPSWFRYDLVWEKSNTVGFLSANKAPLRKHEMVYIFACDNNDDLENNRNLGLRLYAKTVKAYINKPVTEINKAIGNQGCSHFYYINSTQFGLPTKKTYEKLIEIYGIQNMEGFREYQSLRDEWVKQPPKCYNPQKTKGKPYKSLGGAKCEVYNLATVLTINKGDRHPTSILRFNNPKKSLHPTQKPVDLCEWLIKTYSNKGETVLDFTMGSGSTGIACINTDRRFIGIEQNETIFKTARNRLISHELQKNSITVGAWCSRREL